MCLSLYLGLQAKDLTSKVVGMWWPVFAFVALGLEHVVANMFFIPIGLFLGAPELTVGLYIWKGTFPETHDVVFVVVIAHWLVGIIPTALGNILGGAGFCGAFYYWLYIFDEPDIAVDGTYHQRLEEGTLFESRSPTVTVEAVGDKSNNSSGNLAGASGNTKPE